MAGSENRKSRVLGWETAEQSEKGIVGLGWGKTAEEGGLKVQSPICASGVVPGLQKKIKYKKIKKIKKKDVPCWKTKNYLFQRECYK